jgi:long-chain acyl-CoA synthetase
VTNWYCPKSRRGSALAGSPEIFYETAGFHVIVGYGLTECAPLLSYRRLDGNLVTVGCCGKTCLDTEVLPLY